jgi:phage tail sheath protein FI
MLLIFIQASVKNSLLYNVFDPNDAITRQRIKSNIEQFLDLIVAGRGLYRYKVVCDSSNNKAQDIADGLLNVAVYVDPMIPARRILLTTIITKTGAEFKAEVVSQNAGNF